MRLVTLLLCASLAASDAQSVEFPATAAAALDGVIEDAVAREQIPGAVLLVGHQGRIVHRKAYGDRALVPQREPMTVDTIFDVASLTKVVATSASVMKLFEQGKVRLNDRVTEYLPEFQGGKSDITVRHLLTHFSGLRPDVDLKPVWSGYDTGIHLALVDKPVAAPGTRFIYSDINFVLLGEIVRRASGKSLAEYAEENVFRPLGMTATRFQPPADWVSRIAPTEMMPGTAEPLRGVVHDPTCRYMGGIAGHAGLFSNADDLARFAAAMLGRVPGFASPAVIRKFTTPQTPADQPILRGLGWDIDSPFSGNRGELFPIGSFGHTGFTGTSLWIDPASQSFVVLLANSVHPQLRPAITSLRGKVGTVVAAAFGMADQGVILTGYNETVAGGGRRPVARNGRVLNGVDVLAAERFASLQGRRVGLITNHTGLARDGQRTPDVMKAAGVNLVALYSPEHGLGGTEDRDDISDSRDAATGLPVHSLYQGSKRPSEATLRNVDTLVFDIQDVGARFYTYMCTMSYAMAEAARLKKSFIVLDRPNPITGVHVEGPILDPDLHSFVGCLDIPLRHGMTLGEIARFINEEQKLGLDLRVVAMRGWQRGDWFDVTGQTWINPSPNMRSLNAALLYPGLAMLEASKNYSVGRGTDAPFEQVGADWIKGEDLAAALNARNVPGVRAYPTRFQPTASNLAGKVLGGVRFVVTDREQFQSARLGLEMGAALTRLYPGKLSLETNRFLIGSRLAQQAMASGEDARAFLQRQEEPMRDFLARRARYLLY